MSNQGAPRPPFTISSALNHDDLNEIEAIQREIWGPDDVVPTTQLRATLHAGGQVAGAFRDGRMIGFSYGFLSKPHGLGAEGLGLHSHMVAVRNEGRGLGVGQALKWHQLGWAKEQGFSWISWTFDPLQARNARLNLEHLGAVVYDYYVDFYGNMTGPLGGGQSGDRLLAMWLLDSKRVASKRPSRMVWAESFTAETPQPQPQDVIDDEPAGQISERRLALTDRLTPEPATDAIEFWAVTPSGDGHDAEPLIATAPDDAPTVRVAVPKDVTRLFVENPDLVRRWRAAVGVTMSRLLDGTYVTVGFREGAYVIKRNPTAYKGET